MENKNNKKISDFKCSSCETLHKEIQKDFNYNFEDNKFLVLRFSRIWNGIYSRTNIINFNPDKISFKEDLNTFVFSMKAAILHYPASYEDSSKGGHFVSIQKINGSNKWLRISDSFSTIIDKVDEDLSHFYVLFLEKN